MSTKPNINRHPALRDARDVQRDLRGTLIDIVQEKAGNLWSNIALKAKEGVFETHDGTGRYLTAIRTKRAYAAELVDKLGLFTDEAVFDSFLTELRSAKDWEIIAPNTNAMETAIYDFVARANDARVLMDKAGVDTNGKHFIAPYAHGEVVNTIFNNLSFAGGKGDMDARASKVGRKTRMAIQRSFGEFPEEIQALFTGKDVSPELLKDIAPIVDELNTRRPNFFKSPTHLPSGLVQTVGPAENVVHNVAESFKGASSAQRLAKGAGIIGGVGLVSDGYKRSSNAFTIDDEGYVERNWGQTWAGIAEVAVGVTMSAMAFTKLSSNKWLSRTERNNKLAGLEGTHAAEVGRG